MRHAICYVSNSNTDLNTDQINSLLYFWKEKNESNDIKGVLLYSEGNFFQIIEGPKNKVLSLFEKIEKDSRHHGIIKVVDRDISRGSLDGYKVDVLSEAHKVNYEVPLRYYEALKGIPDRVKKPMERMLQMFIATR